MNSFIVPLPITPNLAILLIFEAVITSLAGIMGGVTLVGVGTIVGVLVGESVAVGVGSGVLVAGAITSVAVIVGDGVASNLVGPTKVGPVSRLVVNIVLQLPRKRRKSTKME